MFETTNQMENDNHIRYISGYIRYMITISGYIKSSTIFKTLWIPHHWCRNVLVKPVKPVTPRFHELHTGNETWGGFLGSRSHHRWLIWFNTKSQSSMTWVIWGVPPFSKTESSTWFHGKFQVFTEIRGDYLPKLSKFRPVRVKTGKRNVRSFRCTSTMKSWVFCVVVVHPWPIPVRMN